MSLDSLLSMLKSRLAEPLPGLEAQLSLLSGKSMENYQQRFKELGKDFDYDNARQSSVLILLYEKNWQIFFPLIKRPEYDGVHSGQIALPGGKMEPDDANIIVTALRECHEEVGIPPEQVTVLGTLTPVFIPPSRFWVNVVIGYTEVEPLFVTDPREVFSLIEYPLSSLQDAGSIEERAVYTSANMTMKWPGYVYHEHFIWGATSMILSELRGLVG